MSFKQYLRFIWARKWLALLLFVAIATTGSVYSLRRPVTYTAAASLVLDVRPDPILGGLASAASMATQVEILKSEKAAARVVKMLNIEKSPARVKQWQEETGGKVPLDRYFGAALQRGITVEPVRGSNIITISFTSSDPAFSAAAANAFAQAAVDIAIDLRVEPARQSADWFDGQTKSLRANLEAAQARLSKYQQEHGILVSDERVDEEVTRLNALAAQLVVAQAERADAMGRQRNTGSEMSPDIQQSVLVQSLKGQLATAESKLGEISSIVGTNHPQRLQLEAQIAGLRRQLNAEMSRVSGSTTAMSRATAQKTEELRALVDAQKKQVLALRSQRDQISLLMKDVESAQRAYENATQRGSQLSLESQTNQTNMRLFNPAMEPLDPAIRRVLAGVVGSIIAGLVVAAAAAIGLELRDRRVRSTEDLLAVAGIPVLGVLTQTDSKEPVFRRIPSNQRLLPMAGARP